MTVLDDGTTGTRYSRQDVRRILTIGARQLRAWERSGLIPSAETYTFRDLVQLRKLRDLRATRLSVANIRASVRAMRLASGMTNPLLEAGAVRNGSRLAFRVRGAMVDPISRQFVFDFDSQPQSRVAEVGGGAARRGQSESRINALFFNAVQMEERGDIDPAIAGYESILSLDENHAPACINLGTIYYNRRQFIDAEKFYRRASVSDSNYALAFFDLGNVLDELQRLPEAIESYRGAIRLEPHYADAHYNLALAYERTAQRREALRHWTTYIKLDPIGPWANHARGQARKILEREKLSIVFRNPGTRRGLPSGSVGGTRVSLFVQDPLHQIEPELSQP